MANTVLLEARPYRPFKSSEEYLYAMREDLAEWMNMLYPELLINTENFMDRLDTGVALCKHANNVRKAAEEYLIRRQARNKSMTKSITTGLAGPILAIGSINFLPAAKSGTFFARDNVSNFIAWCRKSLQIFECLLFETDDLIMRKNEKHVILCLLEVARRGAKFGMLAPMLVQMERQIDREIAADNRAMSSSCIGNSTQTENGDGGGQQQAISIGTDANDMYDESDSENEDTNAEPMLMYGPQPQIITNDLKSLDEMVRDLVEKCTCPSQFPMVRVSEGKYRIGDTKVLIFVRILRSHVMVRVGGGWDTLSHYLDKHDPCRCRAQHRSSVAARLITKTNTTNNGIELHKAQVFYERSPPVARKSTNGCQVNQQQQLQQPPQSSSQTVATAAAAATAQQTISPNMANANFGSTLSPPSVRTRSRSRSSTPQRRLTNGSGSGSSSGVGGNNNCNNNNNNNYNNNSQDDDGPLSVVEQMPTDQSGSLKKKQPTVVSGAADISKADEIKSDLNGADGKFENISDNGSEISDEGYRSLGIIQGNNNNNNNNLSLVQTKRSSLNSQTSMEDAELNVRLEQTSTDSQPSPSTDDVNLTPTENDSTPDTPNGTTHSHDPHDVTDDQQTKLFEQSGVYITDDDITIDIATTTGLRKTDFSTNFYQDSDLPFATSTRKSDELPSELPLKAVTLNSTTTTTTTINGTSKIPRSPLPARRKSIDTSNAPNDKSPISRRIAAYRSVRKPAAATIAKEPTAQRDLNTWSAGRTVTKKRPALGVDTFQQPQNTAAISSSTSNGNGNGGFARNSPTRSSQILYDKNGRRIKSTNSSPTKTSTTTTAAAPPVTSPLAQQILEAAGNAKNDRQILEKMKELLHTYTKSSPSATNGSGADGNSEYDDFTTAWVNSNGKLDRSSSTTFSRSPSSASSLSPTKLQSSKRSSAASSTESTYSSRDANGAVSVIATPRRDRASVATSRIPAPIRHNTELY